MIKTSGFALLDVTAGRAKLAKALGRGGKARMPVTIKGFIESAWGGDDGVSQEFEVDITELTTGEIEVLNAKA